MLGAQTQCAMKVLCTGTFVECLKPSIYGESTDVN